MSKVGYRRGVGAEEGTGAIRGSTEETVVVEVLFGTIEPLELG